MSVPDHRHIVQLLFAQGGHVLTTKEGAGRFTEAAASALHAINISWGHLKKEASRTHVVGPDGNRHAVDVVLFRNNGTRVDIIRDSGQPGAALSWEPGSEHEYGDTDWYAPTATTPLAPTLTVRPYWGDDGSRDIARLLFKDYARAGVAPNDGMGVWMGRMAYDVFERGEALDTALARHRQEWCAILGIPVA